MSKYTVCFWQLIVTPHMVELHKQLLNKGIKSFYYCFSDVSGERASSGWSNYNKSIENVIVLKSQAEIKTILLSHQADTIHICQGLRGNGIISYVQNKLEFFNIKYWVVLEDINFNGFFGKLRFILYFFLFKYKNKRVKRFLTIGKKTRFLLNLCVNSEKISEFSYYIKPNISFDESKKSYNIKRFIFIGRLDKNKGVHLIIRSLETLGYRYDYTFTFVGDGPLRDDVKFLCNKQSNVEYLGVVPHDNIFEVLNNKSTLVIMSKHDGWGSVVVEALMSGLNVISTSGVGASYSLSQHLDIEIIKRSSNSLTKSMLMLINTKFIMSNYKFYVENLSSLHGAGYLDKLIHIDLFGDK